MPLKWLKFHKKEIPERGEYMRNKFLLCAALLACLNAPVFAMELGLEESVSLALSQNETIKSAEAGKESVKHQLSAARRATGLRLSWNAGAKRIGGAYYRQYRNSYNPGNYDIFGNVIKSTDLYANEMSNGFTAQFPIYTGGQLEGQIKSAEIQSVIADFNIKKARQQIRFETEQAYYNLLQRENMVQIAQNASQTAQNKLNLIQIQVEEGALPKADILQMQVQIASYNQELTSAKGAYDVALYQLLRLIGKEGESVTLKDKLSYEIFPYTLQEAENYALQHKPDKLIGEYNVQSAKAAVDTVKSGYRPKISATYTRNIADNRGFFRDGRTETWAAGFDMSWNVFDNYITKANVDASKAQVKRAEAEKANIEKNLLVEVRSAYTQMKAAEANIQSAKIAVEQAKESYEIAGVRYEEGVDNLLSVTTAHERLIRAQTNYYNALYNYNLYKAQLKRAMGIFA